MNVAVIYTGHLRSFDKCWANHKWHVLRHFADAKFYCATEGDEDSIKAMQLPGDARVRYLKQPPMVIPTSCPNEWTKGQPYMHEGYAISVHPHAVLGQLWMLREGWRLYEEANDPADLIIRIRPDLWFQKFRIPHGVCRSEFVNSKEGAATFFHPRFEISIVAFTPRWGSFGGVNDRFALLGAKAAQAYFTTYDHIPAMIAEGAPLHPETLVHYAMTRAGISICDDMNAVFGTLRTNGEFRHPEIISADLLPTP